MEHRFIVSVKPNGNSLTAARAKKIITDHVAAAGGTATVTETVVLGRPRSAEAANCPITVKLSQSDCDGLDKLARAEKISRTAMVRRAIHEMIERTQKNNSEKSPETP